MTAPDQHDLLLCYLYSDFCQDSFAATWLGDPDKLRQYFIPWLQEKLAADLETYQLRDLPVLREIFGQHSSSGQ